jgi:hypothetical protein
VGLFGLDYLLFRLFWESDLEFWLGSIGVGRMGLSFEVDVATG